MLAILIVAGIGYFAFNHKSDAGKDVVAKADTVATVNGVAIPKSDYDTQYASAIASLKAQGTDTTSTTTQAAVKAQVVDNLVTNELLSQEVKKAGITASSVSVETQYQNVVTQVGGADKLKTQLTAANMTDAQLRENITKQLEVQTYLLSNIDASSTTASTAEIADFYKTYAANTKDAQPLKTLSDQIKQQIIANKQQALATTYIAGLKAKADIQISADFK